MLPSSATQSPVAGRVGCYFVTDSSLAKPSKPSKPFIHMILLRLLASSPGDKRASRSPQARHKPVRTDSENAGFLRVAYVRMRWLQSGT
jgi:hypothetical protein